MGIELSEVQDLTAHVKNLQQQIIVLVKENIQLKQDIIRLESESVDSSVTYNPRYYKDDLD